MWGKVLIVEDHDDFRNVVKAYLEKLNLGLKIYEASSGEIGISAVLRERPNIVLMDIRLPGINGIDTANKIKSYVPETKIIILTMFETESFRRVFKTEDVSEYIGKSEIFEKLGPTVEKLLGRKGGIASREKKVELSQNKKNKEVDGVCNASDVV